VCVLCIPIVIISSSVNLHSRGAPPIWVAPFQGSRCVLCVWYVGWVSKLVSLTEAP